MTTALTSIAAFTLGALTVQFCALLIAWGDSKWLPIYRDRCLVLLAVFVVEFLIWRAVK